MVNALNSPKPLRLGTIEKKYVIYISIGSQEIDVKYGHIFSRSQRDDRFDKLSCDPILLSTKSKAKGTN